jgi:hypothetical protein
MTEVDRWTGSSGEVVCLHSGDDLFVGLNTPRIVKLDADTMTELDRWIGAAGEIPQSLAREVGG